MPENETPSASPDYVEELRKLNDTIRVIQDIASEIAEEVQYALRNQVPIRFDRFAATAEQWRQRLHPDTLDVLPESVSCESCDNSADSLQQALRNGWTDLAMDESGLSWNFLGRCPECLDADRAELEARVPALKPAPVLESGVIKSDPEPPKQGELF